MWPTLWRRFSIPLSITYDLRAALARPAAGLASRHRTIVALLDQPGIIVHGATSDDGLRAIRRRAHALLYPLDPILPHSELLSLAVREACGAGCPPILAPVDAFPTEYDGVARFVEPSGPIYDDEAWAAAVAETLRDHAARSQIALTFAAERPWARWEQQWDETLHLSAFGGRQSGARHRQVWAVVSIAHNEADAAIAEAIVAEASERGHHVRALKCPEPGVPSAQGPAWESFSTVGALVSALASGAQQVVLCSSMACRHVLSALCTLPMRFTVTTVDLAIPEWLDGLSGAHLVASALVGWPHRVVERAIAGDRPLFRLSPEMRRKIRGVGWLPPARTPVAGREQILLHMGSGDELSPVHLAELQRALESAAKQMGVDVVVVGDASGRIVLSAARHHSSVDLAKLSDEIAVSRLVICAPNVNALGSARAHGVPVLVLSRGDVFGPRPWHLPDRIAHALFLEGEAEVVYGHVPADSLLVAIRGAAGMDRVASGGGGARAVRMIEAGTASDDQPARWRPPVLTV